VRGRRRFEDVEQFDIENQYGFNGDFGFPAFFAGGKLAGDEQAAFSPDAEAFAAVG